MRLSRRLPWTTPDNALARREAERRAAGAPVIDLTTSNPTQVGLAYPADEIAAALSDPRAAVYLPAPLGLPRAREAIAADYARRGAAVSGQDVVLTASSSESYALLFKLLCDPGDAVLVPRPSYPLFDHLAALEAVQVRPYDLFFDGGQWRIDRDSIDAAGARALVVVSPNNPTGSFLTGPDLGHLGTLAAAHDLALIVDEVFADYTHAAPPDAVATVAACPPAGAVAFCLGGLSKACGLPQMKLGWLAVVGPPAATAAARHGLELLNDTYLSVATPVQLALPRLLDIGGRMRTQIAARLGRNRRALAARVGAASPVTLLPVEGGWSQILRVPQTASDEEWALRLLTEDGVLVQPGYFFDLDLGATLVLSLLTEPALFDEGIGRLLTRVQGG